MCAWERADVDAPVALLKEDAILAMPPYAEWYRGRASIAAFLSSTVFAGEACGRQRLLPTRANGQPAFAVYLSDAEDGVYRARAIKLLTLEGGKFAEITASIDPSLFRYFSLPDALQT